MQIFAFESFINVFLLNITSDMNTKNIFRAITFLGVFIAASILPISKTTVNAQNYSDVAELGPNTINYNKMSLRNLEEVSVETNGSTPKDLKIEPLTIIEENVARNLNSHWTWPEYTLDMIDSYSPFLFRTKKSAEVDEVKVLLEINKKGKLSGFEIIGEVDKGLKERLDHVLRKLPKCKPVPGFEQYNPEVFELTIRK